MVPSVFIRAGRKPTLQPISLRAFRLHAPGVIRNNSRLPLLSKDLTIFSPLPAPVAKAVTNATLTIRASNVPNGKPYTHPETASPGTH